ncbi:hypothetical protein C8J57DRAFT_992789, partial [Mycena rebaudengoi]
KEICRLQADLASLAARKFSADDFEEKWKSLPRSEREDLVLRALVKTTSVGSDMEPRRLWCPEVTLAFLAGGSGEGYLRLLTQLMPDDLEEQITEPRIIPQKGVDSLLKSISDLSAQMFRMGRMYYLSLAIWYILLAFYGIEEEATTVKSVRSSNSDSDSFFKRASTVLGEDSVKKMRKEHKAERAHLVNECWGCGKPESSESFKTCGRCRVIGRWIRYCSPECQLNDWKTGPHPHKKICGKPLTEDMLRTTSEGGPAKNEIVPAPVSSFKRSPALLQQAMHLQHHPFPDYMV